MGRRPRELRGSTRRLHRPGARHARARAAADRAADPAPAARERWRHRSARVHRAHRDRRAERAAGGAVRQADIEAPPRQEPLTSTEHARSEGDEAMAHFKITRPRSTPVTLTRSAHHITPDVAL